MYAPLSPKQQSAEREPDVPARPVSRRVANNDFRKAAMQAVGLRGIPAWYLGLTPLTDFDGVHRTAATVEGSEQQDVVPQAKLRIGAVDDPLEHEANRMADDVMRMDAPGGESSQKASVPSALPERPHAVLRSAGEPLDVATRSYMEPRFGHDFSRVRVHTDREATESAQSINALAYTAGSHITFGEGEYATTSARGRRLIAHELAHVVQQESGGAAVVRRSPAPAKRGAHAAEKLEGLRQRLEELRLITTGSGEEAGLASKLAAMEKRVATITENLRKGTIPATSAEYSADKDEEHLAQTLANEPGLEILSRMDTAALRKHRAELKAAVGHGRARGEEIEKIFLERALGGNSANVKGPGDTIASSELERDVLEELGVDPRDVPGGKAVPQHFDVGNFGHTYAEQLIHDLPGGLDAEVKIHLDDGTVRRADRVQWNDPNNRSRGGTVFEIKPDTREWRARGQRQAELYARYLNQLYGGEFRAEVRTYNRQTVTEFVHDLRAAPGTPATHKQTPFVEPPEAARQTGQGDTEVGETARGTTDTDVPVRAVGTTPSVGPSATREVELGGSARDALKELNATQTQLRYVAGATVVAWGYVHYLNIKAHIEEVAKAINMSAALMAHGSPFYKEIDRAFQTEAHAKEVQKYFNSLKVLDSMPRPGDWQWDSTYQLYQIAQEYGLLEMKLRQSAESLKDAQEDLQKEMNEMDEGMKKRKEALLFPITSLEYADAYLFADAGGKINPALARAKESFQDAQFAAEGQGRFALAAIKTIDLRMAALDARDFPNHPPSPTVQKLKEMKLEEFRLDR